MADRYVGSPACSTDIIALKKEALQHFGEAFEVDLCVEECAELIDIIQKYKRGRVTKRQVMAEVVDVWILLIQMRVMLDNEAEFSEIFNCKLERLRKMVS